MESDEALVTRAQATPKSDLRAFETLIARHQDRIIANCHYLTGSPDDAQDLAQEVFVKAYFGLPKFEGRSLFSSWLKRIKVNHCLNFLRKKKRHKHLDVQDPLVEAEPELQVAPGAEQDLAAQGDKERIQSVLDLLPEALRLALIMRDLDGMAYQEIAEELGIGLSAVKMRIKRGREEFRRLYGAQIEMESQQA
jgi:RNA polymerase sigma-70 factor (ECF subfamily)